MVIWEQHFSKQRSQVDLSFPNFISSCTEVLPLVSVILNNTADSLALSFGTEVIQEWETRNEEIPSNTKVQHQWDEIFLKNKNSELIPLMTLEISG